MHWWVKHKIEIFIGSRFSKFSCPAQRYDDFNKFKKPSKTAVVLIDTKKPSKTAVVLIAGVIGGLNKKSKFL